MSNLDLLLPYYRPVAAVVPPPGTATRVGNATQFGVGEGNPNGLASHNGMLHMTAPAKPNTPNTCLLYTSPSPRDS